MADSLCGHQGCYVGWQKTQALRGGWYRGLNVPPLGGGGQCQGQGPVMGAAPGLLQGGGPAQGRGPLHGGSGQARESLRSWRWAGRPRPETAHTHCQGAVGPSAVGDQEQPGPVPPPRSGSRAGL